MFFCAGYQLDFMTGLRRDRWKLICVPNELDRAIMTGSGYELYDLSSDPGETRNLYEERRDVAIPLQERLAAWSEPWYERAKRTVNKASAAGLDAETWRRLNELGYVPDNDRPGDETSPKERHDRE